MYLLKRSTECDATRGTRSMGVDIARGGEDATVFAFFDGDVQLDFFTMRTSDIIQIAEKIIEYKNSGYDIITLDDTGVGGGVTDHLKSKGIEPNAVNFGSAAQGFFTKEIANARAEMYFVLDDEIRKEKIQLLDDEMLLQELSSLRLSLTESSRAYRFEPKEDLSKRLGRSPDRADATALARYGIRLAKKEKKTIRLI
jgi:hypothetical protein